jgi:hypothetical protein
VVVYTNAFVLVIPYFLLGESLNLFQVLFSEVILAGLPLAVWAQQHLKKYK